MTLVKILHILTAAQESDLLLEALYEEASANFGNCADRRSVILGQMEMQVILYQCSKGDMSEEALYKVGLKMLRLHITDHHAFQHDRGRVNAESIEVLLRFRTALADEGLAITSRGMLHREIARVDDSQIEAARDDIIETLSNLGRVQEFFQTWSEWIAHIDRTGSEGLTRHSEVLLDAMGELYEARESIGSHLYWVQSDALMDQWSRGKNELLKEESDRRVERLFHQFMEEE